MRKAVDGGDAALEELATGDRKLVYCACLEIDEPHDAEDPLLEAALEFLSGQVVMAEVEPLIPDYLEADLDDVLDVVLVVPRQGLGVGFDAGTHVEGDVGEGVLDVVGEGARGEEGDGGG